MGPAYFVLAILGCGEGEAACQQVAIVDTRFTSVEACQSASEDTLMRHSDADYPVVVAQCRQAGQKASLEVWSNDVALPEGGPMPVQQPERASFKRQQLARR
ncbi:MAG TPA: hypothetical protein VF631_04535 [Allosphingosinicella sp.]|jgi:hypothetical protein|uniref:hypothetical protein n=1 Tax=Allosphingosinicella sp. TaxID=2823234 RepID=UPI002F27A90B